MHGKPTPNANCTLIPAGAATLRRVDVQQLVGLSKASIYRLISVGTFPPGRKKWVQECVLRPVWDEREIRAWLANRPRRRRPAK